MKIKPSYINLRISQYACFAICLFLMLIVPIVRDHKIIGIDLGDKEGEAPVNTLTETSDGSLVINTSDIGREIIGYSGVTPVEITVRDGRISGIIALPNQETPEFIGSVRNSNLLESLNGKTLQEAARTKIDAVSGATFTSNAVIKNIEAGINYALDEKNLATIEKKAEPLGAKFYVTIVIILAGAILPLFLKLKGYRYVQLILNILVLGFWGGTFISYSLMVSFLSNGITSAALIPLVLMLVTAFIYPMFGRINHYCTWLCPYGSLQELAGKCFTKKVNISASVAKTLSTFRNILWFGLMWLLWTGLWFDWMGYEPFAAFFFRDASPVVLGIAGGFVILSFFIQRPYCRFVCPTGTLFKLSEGRK